MKKVRPTVIYDIETQTYHNPTDKQMSLLYKLASDLKRKNLNKQRKKKLDKLNKLNNDGY